MEKIPAKLIEALKKPLPKEAVKQHPTKAYLSTIKAIYVVERLNEVFGLGGWQIRNEVVEADCTSKNIVVKSTFTAAEYGIIIFDIFGGNDNPDRGDAYKGACTDALTKIASYLYIGMDVHKGLSDHPTTAKAEPQQPKKAELPRMTEKQFGQAKSRILNGEAEIDFVHKIEQALILSKEQKDELVKLIANAPQNVQ